ncbi:MAG: AsmA family protein, partial [Planctomycetota bacterium]
MAKGKVKKIIVGILVVLLVLIVACALVFKLYGDQLIRTGVIAGAQKALQVDVRLEGVGLKLLAGEASLENLEIDNPKGYKNPMFLKLGHAYVDLDVPTLMSDTVEIETIQLEGINLVIEQKDLTTNNLNDILNNL